MRLVIAKNVILPSSYSIFRSIIASPSSMLADRRSFFLACIVSSNVSRLYFSRFGPACSHKILSIWFTDSYKATIPSVWARYVLSCGISKALAAHSLSF